MGDFAADTEVAGSGGRYRARLSADWEVWGPLGGYGVLLATGTSQLFCRPNPDWGRGA